MSRYIDADVPSKRIDEIVKSAEIEGLHNISHLLNRCLRLIEETPTADVVEVVRCKDCKYWKGTGIDTITDLHWGECCKPLGDYRDCETAENDFCSYGERREGNEG